MHSHLSGYPESVYSDCPWMVPVASCGVMAASLWDKQPLRKGERTITNQCVRLLDDTQRTGVEAASHFTPTAFWRNRSTLRGWVDGCILMDWLWLTTKYCRRVMEHKHRGNIGRKVCFSLSFSFILSFLKHIVGFYLLKLIGYDAVVSKVAVKIAHYRILIQLISEMCVGITI